jgi:hypothetical protein
LIVRLHVRAFKLQFHKPLSAIDRQKFPRTGNCQRLLAKLTAALFVLLWDF